MKFYLTKMMIIIFFLLIIPLAIWYWLPICPIRLFFYVEKEQEQKIIEINYNDIYDFNAEPLVKILSYYKEPFFMYKNNVMITPKLYFDRELLWNYTTKSKIPFPDSDYYQDEMLNIWRHKSKSQ